MPLNEHHASASAGDIANETQVISSENLFDAEADFNYETAVRGPRHRKPVDPNKRLMTWVVAICVTAFAITGIVMAIVFGVRQHSEHQLVQAQELCQQVGATVQKKAAAYQTYANGEAASAKSITAAQVEDGTTVTELTQELTAAVPQTVKCSANTVAQFNAQTAKLNEQITWYDEHQASLEEAVRHVQDSQQQKTLCDARAALSTELEYARKLLVVTKGRVQNDAVWIALSDLVTRADDVKNGSDASQLTDITTQIKNAAQSANDSYRAKLDADEASAQEELEANLRQEATKQSHDVQEVKKVEKD